MEMEMEMEMDYGVIPFRRPEDESRAEAIERLVDEMALHLLSRLMRHHEPTYQHSLRVAALVRDLAPRMGWPSDRIRTLARAALLHDLGKVAVPLGILEKPGALSDREWAFMDRHSDVGSDMLGTTRLLADEAYIVRHHHRWYAANSELCCDYDALLDRGIDLLAVCDAYDAMVSERPYRSGRAIQDALVQLEEGAGDQFCPQVVQQFRGMLNHRAAALRC